MAEWDSQKIISPHFDDHPSTARKAIHCPLPPHKRSMERLPVEIWQRILCLVIFFPLLPLDGDYDHHNIRAAGQTTCTFFAEYKKSERTRTNVRLVCTSWNEFLEEYSDRFVRLTPYVPDGYWPPVKRWDRVVRLEGNIYHYCPDTSGKSCWPASRTSYPSVQGEALGQLKRDAAVIKKKYLPLLGSRCKAILYPHEWRSELERLDHITLLNLNAFGEEEPQLSFSSLSKYTNLRHLLIAIPTLVGDSTHIVLPFLDTLSLLLATEEFGTNVPEEVLPSHIGIWDLPRLVYFEFDSSYTNPWDIDMLHFLLRQIGGTISRFHFGRRLLERYDNEYDHVLLLEEFWGSVPSLACLGVGILDVSQIAGPPSNYSIPSINLFIDTYHMWVQQGPPSELITNLPIQWPSGRLGDVKLESTWGELHEKLRIYTDEQSWIFSSGRPSTAGVPGSASVAIFDTLHFTGRSLTDREGVPFSNEVRESLLSIALKAELQ